MIMVNSVEYVLAQVLDGCPNRQYPSGSRTHATMEVTSFYCAFLNRATIHKIRSQIIGGDMRVPVVGVAPTTAGDTRPLGLCSLVAIEMIHCVMGFCGIRISYGDFTIAYFDVNVKGFAVS